MIKINNGISTSITESSFSATCRFLQRNVIPENEVGMYGSVLIYKEYNGIEYEMMNMSTYSFTNYIISSQLSIRYQLQPYTNTSNAIGLLCLAIPDVTKVIATIGELNYSTNRRLYEYYIYQNEIWWVQDERASIYPSTDYGWGKISLEDQEELYTLFYSKASQYEYYYDSVLIFAPCRTQPSPEEWVFETSCVDGMVTIVGTSNLGNSFGPLVTNYTCESGTPIYSLECNGEYVDILRTIGLRTERITTTYECDGGLCEVWQGLKIRKLTCNSFKLIHDNSEFTYYPVIRDFDNPMTQSEILNFNILNYPFSYTNRIAPDKEESILDVSTFEDNMYLIFMIYQNNGIWNHVVIPMYKLCALEQCLNKLIKKIICSCDCAETDDCDKSIETQNMYEVNKMLAITNPILNIINYQTSLNGQILSGDFDLTTEYFDLGLMIKKANILIGRCGLCNDEIEDCGCN